MVPYAVEYEQYLKISSIQLDCEPSICMVTQVCTNFGT
jgi:hypothetical protein